MRHPQKKFLKRLFLHAIQEVQPEALFRKYLHVYDNTLYYRNTPLEMQNKGRLVLAGSGKASQSMAQAILPYLPLKPHLSLLITREGKNDLLFDTCPGNHPLPASESLIAGHRMRDFLNGLEEEDTLIYLLSGGSSAMMELPLPGLTLQDLQSANRVFLESGMDIREINILRSRLSQVKGGKLAALCKARIYVFVLSDVMGNDFSTIGSGPFYPADISDSAVRELIAAHELEQSLPRHLIAALKTNNEQPPGRHAVLPHFLIGSNMDLLEAADAFLNKKNFPVRTFPESLYGEARKAGAMIAEMICKEEGAKPSFLLFGGETTVSLNEKPGKGGRSQEIALSALSELRNSRNYCLLCAGSDGIDGNSDAAGALIDRHSYRKAQELGLLPENFLAEHDSYRFHQYCGTLLFTGPTGTNVADIVIALID